MALISEGIDKVRVIELPGGIWADGKAIEIPREVLVRWRSSLNGKFYQIYVNGRYAGETVDGDQRQMVVQVPTSFVSAVRIEVFAVEAVEVNTDFSGELNSSGIGRGRVRITLLRDQSLPADSTARVYFNNGSGEIDYDNPLDNSLMRIWPAWQDKAGFGMSRFGLSDFGRDGAAAVGFGKGCFGRGQFGLDADTLEWVSEPLPAGVYKFTVKVISKTGNESIRETGQVTVMPGARPVEHLSVYSFDKQANQLVLKMA